MDRRNLVTRVGVVLATASALMLGTAGAASAHIGISGTTTAAGGSSVLTLSFSHGCEESPTTRIAVAMPEDIYAATPTRLAGWKAEKVMATLDTPIKDSHGNEVSERVAQIVYTADDPVPDGVRAAFEIAVTLPEDAAGQTLYFPTVQTCQEGQNDWIEIPAEGQSHDDVESPAPSLDVTETDDTGGHGEATEQAEAAKDSQGSYDALSIVALVVGGLGVILGGTAVVRGRKTA